MERKPVKLRKGMELMKRRGKTGPIRTVMYVGIKPDGDLFARLQWTETRQGRGTQTMEVVVDIGENGFPAGYVLAKDRQAVRK